MRRTLALIGAGLIGFAAAYAATSHWSVPRPGPPGMVWIPGGEFTMGSDAESAWPEERPAHRVRVGGFWLDRTEVTNAQFRDVRRGDRLCHHGGEAARRSRRS